MIHAKDVFVATILFTTAIGSTASQAQTGDGLTLDEIVVTAQKRAENLQEIPKQVQVVTTESLQNSNVTNINDLVKLVPSLSGPNNNAMGGNTSMRGVGTAANSLGANSKVGIVLDDIPIPSRAGGAKNLLDIAQVEVLPGPQGTLAGRNALGGLINMVTRSPSRTEPTGIFQVSATDDNEYIAGAYLSAPISDQFAYSVSASYQDQRGLAYNVALNKWDVATHNYGVRGKLLWAPTDGTEVTLSYSRSKERQEGGGVGGWANIFSKIDIPLNLLTSTYECLALTGAGACNSTAPGKKTFTQLLPGITPSSNNFSYYSVNRQIWNRTTDMGVLRLEQATPIGTFTAIGSVLKEEYPQLQNWFAYPMINMNIRPEFDGFAHVYNLSESKTMEARLASNTDQAWTYLVGMFWSEVDNRYDYQRVLQTFMADRRFSTDSQALFASTSYTFPSETTVRVGARYEKDDINYLWNFYRLPATTKTLQNGLVISFPAYSLNSSSGTHNDSFYNYDFGVQQKLGDDAMVYLNYAHANQGPLYDAENTVDAEQNKVLTPLPSEEVDSIELGFKSEWFNNRLQFNVNIFNMEFKNYQATTNVLDTANPLATPQIKLWAAGKVSSKGVEVNTSALLTDKIRLDFAGMYNKAVIDEWKNAPCYTNQPVGTGPGQCSAATNGVQPNIAGNWLADAPRVKLTAIGTYSDTLGVSSTIDYDASVTVRYNTETRGDQLGNPVSNLPSRTFVDANLSFTKGNIQLSFFGVNLFEDFAETYGTGLGYGLVVTPNSGYSANQRADGSWPVTTRNLSRDNVRYFGARLKVSF